MDARDEEQRRYFDVPAHQYQRRAILRPPLGSQLEIGRIVAALDGIPTDGPVIDFGAGTGRLTIPLARAGYSVLAVDVSEQSLSVLEGVASELGLRRVETAPSLPEGGGAAAVVGADVLHHVELDEYLPRIRASLREGGRVAFSEPGAWNPAWYPYLAIFHSMRVERRIVRSNIPALRRTFGAHGFRDIRITGLGIVPRPLFGWSEVACRSHDAVGDWPVLRWFAYRYLVEARV